MSFTSEIKQEVSYNELKACCTKAELSALVQLTSSLTISSRGMGLVMRSENPTTAKRIMILLKDSYEHIETELLVEQKTNLRKNNVYVINVLSDARMILEDLGLYSNKGLLDYPMFSIVAKDCCARAYLAGAFIAFGSCNSPLKTNYHLEIALMSQNHANFVVKLIDRFGLGAKVSKRRNKFVVYLKKADSISDFLKCIGAQEAVMNFENSRISRDFKNNLQRLDNCDIANEVKSLNAAREQVQDMEIIFRHGKYDDLNEKLKVVVDLRMKYQEATLLELTDIYYRTSGETISKSGLKHRLNKINAIAKELR